MEKETEINIDVLKKTSSELDSNLKTLKKTIRKGEKLETKIRNKLDDIATEYGFEN